MPDSVDHSNGYEAIATDYLAARSAQCIGSAQIAQWALSLPRPATLLDLGCGNGIPVTRELLAAGHCVFAIDASAAMIRAFQAEFPDVMARCEPVERSNFFNQRFDGVVAIGLMFLLPPQVQLNVIERISGVLQPNSRFLFTAPSEPVSWPDNMTGQSSRSLGKQQYIRALESAGMQLADTFVDEGNNHYYNAEKAR